MKIQNSTITMRSRHTATTQTEVRENMLFWVGDRPPAGNQSTPPVALTLSSEAQRQNNRIAGSPPKCAPCRRKGDHPTDSNEDLQLRMLEKMIEQLLGK
jgi:hypothetical protein